MSYPFKPKRTKLEFSELVKYLRTIFKNLADFRKGAKQTIYTMEDAAISAFSVFFMLSSFFFSLGSI